jgi:peptidoglycan/xylan/chitin deacetylase (PgdA/CDA1 family)
MTSIVPVFLYHSVAEGAGRDGRFTVSPAMFEAHADAIEASGRVTLEISELAAGLRGERPLPERAAAITFDDGFADNYDAVQSLLRRGLRSTLYVTTGELGAGDRLMPAQVTELSDVPGIEVGAHTVHHLYLDELDRRELKYEVAVSKAQLEDVTRAPVRSFAYPHGAYDQRVRDAVIAAGYRSAVAVKNAVAHVADDPFAIARWTVTNDTTASRIAQVLHGENVPLAWSHERVRTRAYRTVRRQRRRVPRMLGLSS